jgi:hypothetical protein
MLLSLTIPITAQPQVLPSTPAETLSGAKLSFPEALNGKPGVCIFGFNRSAYRKLLPWLEPLAREGVNVWAVAHVSGLPLVRDAVRVNLRRSATDAQQARTVIMTQDGKTWKQILQVENEDRPVVVVIDRSGQAVWMEQAAYSRMMVKKVRAQLAKIQ